MDEAEREPMVRESSPVQEDSTGGRVLSQVDAAGIPRLDEVLGGGVPRGTLLLIVGPPGSGKTTLAAQMTFAAARAGRPVLILTALSEPTLKLVAHLRTYSFFDERLIGGPIEIISLDQFLVDGLEGTARAVAAEAVRRRASLVMLDGFSGVRGAAGEPQVARRFLYDLGTRLAALAITTIITSEATPRDPALFPEATSADVLIGMHYDLDGVRARRAIEAVKVRGAALLPGLHGLRLDADGVRVYPRLEARIVRDDTEDEQEALAAPPARVAFDLPALDALLDGGLSAQTPTLVLGSPGTGKTLLGLQFALAGVRAGEPAVFLGFQETRAELLRKGDPFALGPALRRALAPGGGITLLRQPPVERDADVLADDLLRAVEATGARRVVIDSIALIQRAVEETSDARRVPNYLGALMEALRRRQVTTLVIRELETITATTLALEGEWVSLLAANMLWLQRLTVRGRLYRLLSVPKMRYSAHEDTLREFTIAAPEGLRVLAPFESESGLLDGIARQQEQPSR